MIINLEEKYKEIKKDIIDNISEVFDRETYYTHKYRGNYHNDINVAIDVESTTNKIVQIYLRNKNGYIRDIITVTPDNQIMSNIDTDLIDKEIERKLMFGI